MVKEDAYFLQISRYIHLNPVKAGIVEHPEDYPYSSYRTIIGLADDKIVAINQTQSYFGKKGMLGYREFIEDIGHKYSMQENKIKKSIGEDVWLPW